MAKKTLPSRAKSSKNKGAARRAPTEYSTIVRVDNELGIHARSAALFAKVANEYEAEVTVEKGTDQINGKSIMGLLMLAAAKGSQIKIIAQGPDAAEALRATSELVRNKFGEK